MLALREAYNILKLILRKKIDASILVLGMTFEYVALFFNK